MSLCVFVHLVDAPLRGDVEAVLSRGEALHLQDLGGDRRGQEDVGLGLLEPHRAVDRDERQTLGCRTTPADKQTYQIYVVYTVCRGGR